MLFDDIGMREGCGGGGWGWEERGVAEGRVAGLLVELGNEGHGYESLIDFRMRKISRPQSVV